MVPEGCIIFGQVVVEYAPLRTDNGYPQGGDAVIGDELVDLDFIGKRQQDRFPEVQVIVLEFLVQKGDFISLFPPLLVDDK